MKAFVTLRNIIQPSSTQPREHMSATDKRVYTCGRSHMNMNGVLRLPTPMDMQGGSPNPKPSPVRPSWEHCMCQRCVGCGGPII